MPDVLLAPYLPLPEEISIGPWTLTPFSVAAERMEASPLTADLRRATTRLVEAYKVSARLGAVAFPTATGIGGPFSRSALRPLGHALLAGVISGNPKMAVPEEDVDPNAGFAVATAENARLFGHPLADDGDSFVTEKGVLVRTTAGHLGRSNKPLPPVPAPVELPRPLFVSFDHELAEATFAVLNAEGEGASRLTVVLDWYRIALSNAEAVTLEVRVGATRSALEVLLEEDLIGKLAGAYCDLVRESDVPKTVYSKGQCGWGGGVSLSDNGFWLARLNKLRNAIVHGDGDGIPDELWEYGGHPQLSHIHDRLIDALRAYLAAESSDPLLRVEPAGRLSRRNFEKWAAAHRRPDGPRE